MNFLIAGVTTLAIAFSIEQTMNSRLVGIITLSTSLLLTLIPLASAETPTRSIRESGILPYLLNNPQNDSLVRVRCISRLRPEVNRQRSLIRDSLLQPNVSDRHDTITIEIVGSCRHVKIHVQDDSDYSDDPAYSPYIDDHRQDFQENWLTRQGSGWHWLLRNKQ